MELNDLLKQWTSHQQQVDAIVTTLKEAVRFDKQRVQNLPELRESLTKLGQFSEKTVEIVGLKDALCVWTEAYRAELEQAENAFKTQFGSALDKLLQEQGLALSGQYPELKAGLYTIELELDKGRALLWYGPKQERMAECRPAPKDVAKSLRDIQKELGAPKEISEIFAPLRQAYHRVVQNQTDQPASITDVLTELAHLLQDVRFQRDPRREFYRSYGRADFSYDLFRLRQWLRGQGSGHPRMHLIVATRAHTKKRQDFLWVPDSTTGRGTTYSHLQFAER